MSPDVKVHVICCNDSIQHVLVNATDEEAKAKLEELARKERTLPAGTLAFEFNKGTWVAGREWKRAAGVPSWNGIGNHRDFRRWCRHVLAPLVPIAHDALTEDRRDVAIQILCEAVPLEVAIEWTRPTKNSIGSSR